jgi:hypothetical protein
MDDVSRTERQTPSTSIIHISTEEKNKSIDFDSIQLSPSFCSFCFWESLVARLYLCDSQLSYMTWSESLFVLSFMSPWTTSQIHFDLVPPFFIRYGHYDGPFVCVRWEEIRRRALDCLQAKTPSLVSSSSWIIVIISQQPS